MYKKKLPIYTDFIKKILHGLDFGPRHGPKSTKMSDFKNELNERKTEINV